MEVTQPLRIGLRLAVGLNPQIKSPSVYDNKTQPFMQQSTIPRDSWECQEEEFHEHGKNSIVEIS